MKKKETILHFTGLYGDEYGKYSSEYIFLELISTRSQTFDWIIKPHVHAHLFQVFFVTKGSLEFLNIQAKSHIEAPCILLIPPTFLHGLVYAPDIEGYILSISDLVIQDIFKNSDGFLNACDRIHVIEKFESNNLLEEILQSLTQLEKELFGNQKERMIILKALITTIFVSIYRLCDVESLASPDSSLAKYFRKFLQLTKTSKPDKSIPSYAADLRISTVHLNRICRAMSGQSAQEIINQNTMMEAQKYLLHTSYSISEIAYLLQFEYPNYFARKFKKYVGMTPQEFRRLDRS